MNIFNKIVALVLPQTCRACGELIKKSLLCENCLKKIKWVSTPFCTICGLVYEKSVPLPHPCPACIQSPPAFHWHRSAAIYRDPINQLIIRFKYGNTFDLSVLYASWLYPRFEKQILEADYLIPVPLSKTRLRSRTYNQSLLIARAISKKSGVPVLANSLRKIRHTDSQTHLPKNKRLTNLSNAFLWMEKKHSLKGKKVLLIDDVYTTGSTLSQCARVLKGQKPKEVGALTVAFNLLTPPPDHIPGPPSHEQK